MTTKAQARARAAFVARYAQRTGTSLSALRRKARRLNETNVVFQYFVRKTKKGYVIDSYSLDD